ncbi:LOW QUALITY PROTEIN: hypothetical protein PHMEG_000158 [Phytophthora megakarya]|uniref:Uncharacterized protein n=1 Tax=Phytophthora megakarya TaxID=4795 RepID=A0A225X3Q7_9STRA|nr:LOW QUALITY PROTEIN: hypothetical protein PHMEG_000158 [Phytophthora megakarya]
MVQPLNIWMIRLARYTKELLCIGYEAGWCAIYELFQTGFSYRELPAHFKQSVAKNCYEFRLENSAVVDVLQWAFAPDSEHHLSIASTKPLYHPVRATIGRANSTRTSHTSEVPRYSSLLAPRLSIVWDATVAAVILHTGIAGRKTTTQIVATSQTRKSLEITCATALVNPLVDPFVLQIEIYCEAKTH